MQLHELRPIHKLKKPKRIGRGGKRGTYSGRGIKGQGSRAGRKFKPVIRELIKKYPKLRGYRTKSKFKNPKSKAVVLNLGFLERKFNPGETISPQSLLEKGIIRRMGGRVPQVKILGEGNTKKSLIIEGCKVSKSAKEKIEKAAGQIIEAEERGTKRGKDAESA